jgi:hypothetical protein
LLAYLKSARTHFDEKKLYPVLSDLIFHYDNLVSFKEKKQLASNRFPKRLSLLDFEKFTTEYEKMVEDDSCIEEIEQIISFALPLMKQHLKNGAEIYEFVEDKIEIHPLGIQPLNNETGYMFVNQFRSKATQIYSYQITIFETVQSKYRGIKTNFVGSYVRSISNTLENIKISLLRDINAFNTPATYLVDCGIPYPMEETLLPIAKRSLVRYIAQSNTTSNA